MSFVKVASVLAGVSFAAGGYVLHGLQTGKYGTTKLELQDSKRYYYLVEQHHGFLMDHVQVRRCDRFAQQVVRYWDDPSYPLLSVYEKTDHWSFKPFDVQEAKLDSDQLVQVQQLIERVIKQNPDLKHQEMLEAIVQAAESRSQ